MNPENYLCLNIFGSRWIFTENFRLEAATNSDEEDSDESDSEEQDIQGLDAQQGQSSRK